MCKVGDLVVMVVEPDDSALKRSCASLNKLGITKMVCVHSYAEAIETLEADQNVDIVLSDYEIEDGQELGGLLVSVIKKKYPSILVVLMSKAYSCSVVLGSLKFNADDVLDKNRETDIEDLLGKWIAVAQLHNEMRNILNGNRK